jgi:hypothetical protein
MIAEQVFACQAPDRIGIRAQCAANVMATCSILGAVSLTGSLGLRLAADVALVAVLAAYVVSPRLVAGPFQPTSQVRSSSPGHGQGQRGTAHLEPGQPEEQRPQAGAGVERGAGQARLDPRFHHGHLASDHFGQVVEVTLGRHVGPSHRRQVLHQRRRLLPPEQLLETAVQAMPGFFTDSHDRLPSADRQGEGKHLCPLPEAATKRMGTHVADGGTLVSALDRAEEVAALRPTATYPLAQ